MNTLLSYSGIITKVKAMKKSFISNKDYYAIANLETPADFISFLKNHPGYKEVLGGLNETSIHRGQVEEILINSLYLDFSKIYKFADLHVRKILDLTFFRYEINVMKACSQQIFNVNGEFDLQLFDSFFTKHSKVNIKALAASKNLEEYVNNLKGTEYYPLFYNLLNLSNATSFDYEMQLDIYYYKKAWKLKEGLLKGNDLKAVTHSLGTEIDLLNIMWLYRSKKFYNMASSDSYAYVIPVNYKLKKDQLIKLMECFSIDEFIAVLKTTYYERICNALIDGSIEIIYQKIMQKIYQENKSKYPTSVSPINYYLFHKQNEIRLLTTALECIRYKLEPQDTLKYILQ